jgi:hypothetical protein
MYAALASVALGSAALLSAATACQYSEHASAVVDGIDALRIPITTAGAGAQNECASTAQAFGLTTAAIGMPSAHLAPLEQVVSVPVAALVLTTTNSL